MVDVSRPLEPRFVGCFDGDGYTHDAQCVTYLGPDDEYGGREICFNANEDTLTIVDVTAKDEPRMLSRSSYAGNGYAHQGWLTEDHAYFLLGDEFDERQGDHPVRTYVWAVTDLDAPFVAGAHTVELTTIDHNLFVSGSHVFQANYRTGLRVLRKGDLSRAELAEVAYFDTYPESDGRSFSGAWGGYPFFESGVVVASDINRGLFVLEPHLDAVPECDDGIDNDGDGRIDHGDDPSCADPDGPSEQPRSDVAVDVKPGNRVNALNPKARGLLAVAVLGSDHVDVSEIDPASLRLGPGNALARNLRPKDVDADGWLDLLAHYPLAEASLATDTSSVCLAWETWGGTAYAGCDMVRSVPGTMSKETNR